MPTAKMTSKGQITIPKAIRESLKLKPGDEVVFFEIETGQFVMRPRNASIRDLEGCIPKLDYIPTIEEMNEAIADAAAESYLRSVGTGKSRKDKRSKDEAA